MKQPGPVVRFVRSTASGVAAWWGFAAAVPLMLQVLFAAVIVLIVACVFRLVRR